MCVCKDYFRFLFSIFNDLDKTFLPWYTERNPSNQKLNEFPQRNIAY